MVDERIKKMAKILVEHSTKVKKGDKVIISGDIIAEPLIKEVYRLCLKKGSYPAVHAVLPGMSQLYFKNASKDQLKKFPDVAMFESKKGDVFIGIWGTSNTRQLSNIDPKRIALRSKTTHPISKVHGHPGKYATVMSPILSLLEVQCMRKKETRKTIKIRILVFIRLCMFNPFFYSFLYMKSF